MARVLYPQVLKISSKSHLHISHHLDLYTCVKMYINAITYSLSFIFALFKVSTHSFRYFTLSEYAKIGIHISWPKKGKLNDSHKMNEIDILICNDPLLFIQKKGTPFYIVMFKRRAVLYNYLSKRDPTE